MSDPAAKLTVYIETTVVSYLTARPSRDVVRASHQLITRTWWDSRRNDFALFTSDAVVVEAGDGDQVAAAERLRALEGIPRLPIIPPAAELARGLAGALRLPPRAQLDALHIAIAATHGMRFLLTWNCTHLANGHLADTIERACASSGVAAPRILTPELLMEPP